MLRSIVGDWVKSEQVGGVYTLTSSRGFVKGLDLNSKAVVERRGFRAEIFNEH